jgi:hypothetical protein
MTQDVATLPQAPSWYRGLGRYWALAGGELVSSAGSVMALFAVDTWVYEESRSVTVYGAVQLLAMLPAMLFAPFAGAWLDRLNGRRVIVGANVAIALVTLGLWALARTNRLSVWSFCIAAPLLASLGALLQLSIATATAHLVPVERFARASGVVGAGQALIGTCVPLAAGFTMQAIGIGGALLVDFATTLVAAVTAWCIVFPDPPRVDRPGERRSIVHETANGLRYLKSRAGLLGLLVLSGALAFAGNRPGARRRGRARREPAHQRARRAARQGHGHSARKLRAERSLRRLRRRDVVDRGARRAGHGRVLLSDRRGDLRRDDLARPGAQRDAGAFAGRAPDRRVGGLSRRGRGDGPPLRRSH